MLYFLHVILFFFFHITFHELHYFMPFHHSLYWKYLRISFSLFSPRHYLFINSFNSICFHTFLPPMFSPFLHHQHHSSLLSYSLTSSAYSSISTSPSTLPVFLSLTLQAPLHEKIRLEFHDFDITGSVGCSGDYISISSRAHQEGRRRNRAREEEEEEEEEVDRYCGAQGPNVVTSKGDTLVVTFVSNAKGSCRGFNASYSVREGVYVCIYLVVIYRKIAMFVLSRLQIYYYPICF